MTEKELIRGVTSRERPAVAELVDTYRHRVIKTAYYFLGNMQDAEDLAQDVFLEVLASLNRFRQNAALSTWIYRITVNRSLNALKKKKRMQLVLRAGGLFGLGREDRDLVSQDDSNEENSLENRERRQLLEETVGSLPENQRTAFILCKYEELSYKEISEVMGVSVSSVESLMHRARLNLQKNLSGYFSEYNKKRS
jgi:RNA polymerase sigma-70 factor (ECF subfamily)